MISKVWRLIVGIVFIPIVAGYGLAFFENLVAIRQVQTPWLIFLYGITAYLSFHVLIAAPTKAYVFGHELMHASAAWISGGKVKGFHVGEKKGSVTTNKITAFIALAPYLVPVYSILLAVLYGIAGFFWNVGAWSPWFFFGLGVTLTFHLVFTISALKEKQTDLDVAGPVLALDLILWANLTFVVLAISLMLSEVRFWPYLANGFRHSKELYLSIFHQLFLT